MTEPGGRKGDADAAQPRWWQEAVCYQIWPRSFLDTDGDGVGDLEGVRRGLEHLAQLGIDAIWLCPFYPSPLADFGYDVSDYCDVDPRLGSLELFDRLLEEAHDRGIRVLVDFVPNHTSDQHPWFLESRRSRTSPKRRFYVWRDGPPGTPAGSQPPNGWRAAFGQGSAWTFDEATGQWYLHLFLPSQPDLDWRNPEVRGAMHDVLRFWLDRGVDGFRVDVVHGLGKDVDHPLEEPGPTGLPWSPEGTHPVLRELRALVDAYPGDRVLVGEVFLLSTAAIAEYYGHGDELHLAFDFPLVFTPFEAQGFRQRVEELLEHFEPKGAWPCLTLSNLDVGRHRSRYGGSEARARAAAVALLTLRGTPFLYQGEELGLDNAEVPPEHRLDPGGRDGCRAPIPWERTPPYGWASAEPFLPWPPEPERRNIAAEWDDPTSVLHLYRRLLAARRASPALRRGRLRLLETPDGVLGYERTAHLAPPQGGHDGLPAGGSPVGTPSANEDPVDRRPVDRRPVDRRPVDRRVVLVNFGAEPCAVRLDDAYVVEVSSDGAGEGSPFRFVLGPEQAVVLRPAPTPATVL
jgi:alpha-glucosidase